MKREELTPIELECNMGPDVNGVVHRGQLSNEKRPYYLKSEADKVIAEKDKVIAKLIDIDSDNRSAYYKDLAMMAKDVAHHKYKRCLAMAEVCKHKRWRADVCDEQGYDYARSTNHMNRWLELAEKFKDEEAK